MSEELSFVTKLLKYRLSSTARVNINIIPPNEAELPPNLNEHLGRFVGYFIRLHNNDPSFVLFVREDPEKDISHAAVFYVGYHHQQIQPTELSRFSHKISRDIKLAAVNIASKVARYFDLSVLLQAVEFLLHPRLLDNWRSCLSIDVISGVSTISRYPDDRPPLNCGVKTQDERSEQLLHSVKTFGVNWIEFDIIKPPDTLDPSFDVLRIVYQQHYCYAIHYKSVKSLQLLFSHRYMFRVPGDYKHLMKLLADRLKGYSFSFIGVTRYYGHPGTRCNSSHLIRACLIALKCPLVAIKSADIDAVLPDGISEHELIAWCCQPAPGMKQQPPLDETLDNRASQLSNATTISVSNSDGDIEVVQCHSQLSTQIIDVEGLSSQGSVVKEHSQSSNYTSCRSTSSIIDVVGCVSQSSSVAVPSMMLSQFSSQATERFDPSEINTQLKKIRAMKELKKDISSMLIPPIIEIVPQNDPHGRILTDNNYFIKCLKAYANLWQAYARVKVLDLFEYEFIHCDVLEGCQADRFILIPILKCDNIVTVIIDQENCEWTYLIGSSPNEDRSVYQDVIMKLKSLCKVFVNWPGRPLVMTTYFHVTYTNIHQLMAVFYIGRLFKYVVALPCKIIYAEREFRHISWRICHSLQVTNQSYNLQNNLIRNSGYLMAKAYKSQSSPVHYTSAVVPQDQCPYCKQRGFNNLGRHIVMAHGGQARSARTMRTLRENM